MPDDEGLRRLQANASVVLGSLATLLVGYAIAYGQTPLVDEIQAWKFFFHLVFQATAATIVSIAMAELSLQLSGSTVIDSVSPSRKH